ncbi:MAG: tetratricopeptide repeat protein [Bryobacteraceae bacterium]|nr:tetratricopeptide repeat protein [Bryobacteraceae bacterium]
MLSYLSWFTLALVFYQGQSVSMEQVFAAATADLATGRYAEAEAGFQRVLQREPNNLGALGNLGVLYSRQDRPQKAIDVYRRALRLLPNEPGIILNLGLAYLKLDDSAQAKPLFAALARQNSPYQRQAAELLAICQLQTGEPSLAVRGLEQLATGENPSPGVFHFLALAYVKQKDLPRAQATLAKLYERLPAAQAHYLEGRVWYDSALFDRALESFRQAATADPHLPGLALETGKTYVSLRDYPAAIEQLRQAPGVEGQYFLGALLVQEGQYAEATPLLAAVTEARPDLWGTHYYLGKAELALGHSAKALPLLQKAANRAPDESAVQYQLGRALQSLGRAAEAKQAFARVAQLKARGNTETIRMK